VTNGQSTDPYSLTSSSSSQQPKKQKCMYILHSTLRTDFVIRFDNHQLCLICHSDI
jgi:uncharacterized protein YfaA (DUF2138 family)